MGPIRMVIPQAEGASESAPPEGQEVAEIQFLNAEGKPVGRKRLVHVPENAELEAPASSGRIVRAESELPIAFRTRLPAGATHYRVTQKGREAIVASIRDTASPFPRKPDSRKRMGGANPSFILAVMADRYDNEAAFHADCQKLLSAIESMAPFSNVPGKFALEALFWKSSPTKGLFDPLSFGTGNDLIHGDRNLAAKFWEEAGKPGKLAIVLLNLDKRGGAGGNSALPAWVTNTSSATDLWTDVAIHELGHAFGLGDEYDSPNTNPPPGLEPNISSDPSPDAAPWAHLCTDHGSGPTAPFNGGASLPAGTVGTFQGARYETAKFYRPQFQCMMRSTSGGFCLRCQELIAAQL